MIGFLTPDVAPTGLKQICITVPTGEEWGTLVRGALAVLLQAENFEKNGVITPDEAADYFNAAFWYTMMWEACMPIGSIVMFGTDTPPEGWLFCDGTEYDVVDYPLLADVIGDQWGGSLPDTFCVPDMRSRSPMCDGQGSGLSYRQMGDMPGTETHQLTIAQMPEHGHYYDKVSLTGPFEVGAGVAYTPISSNTQTSLTGGGTAHPNVHPVLVVPFVIKAE